MARVKFVNSMGGLMTVDESRKEEYLAMGYKLADDSQPSNEAAKKPIRTKKKEV